MKYSNMNSRSSYLLFFLQYPSTPECCFLSHAAVPTIVNASETLTVVQPDAFFCQAKDAPRPAITWWRHTSNDNDLVEIMMGDPGYSIEETVIGDYDLRSNLTILGTLPGDTGVYLCQTQNIINSAAESAFLTAR